MKRSFVALLAFPVAVAAQQQPFVGPPIRPLGAVAATSKEVFGPTITVRHTGSGVLVNDIGNRRLLHFDATLADFKVVADTTPATASAYAGRTANLIAFKGDSSLFIDQSSSSMLVIDGSGQVARVMALPRSRDAMVLGTAIGNAGIDAQGRIVYRAMPNIQFRAMGGPGGVPTPPEVPDTAPIVRVDLASRVTDTINYVKTPRPKIDITRDESTGRMNLTTTMNPLPTVDEMVVTSDGSVGIVRGRDYHVDWIRPDGTTQSSAKMSHNWQRMSDEEKGVFLDSLKAARERLLASQPRPAAPPGGSSTTTTGPGGEQQRTIVMGPGPGAAMGGGPMGGGPMGMNNANVNWVPANELPDYKPPFFVGNVRADGDGNIWVLTIPTRAVAGGPVYDVINGKGELVDRVQVPAGRTIVGFGSGGVVYLASRDGTKTTLEKASVK